MAMNEMRQGSSVQPILPDDHIVKYTNSQSGVSFEKRKEVYSIRNDEMSWVNTGNLAKQQQSTQKSASHDRDNRISANVFAGKLFCFSGSFPADQVVCSAFKCVQTTLSFHAWENFFYYWFF